jgi:uncharacterized membrane protein
VRELVETRAGRVAVSALVAVAAITVVGVIALWPGEGVTVEAAGIAAGSEAAEIVKVAELPCPSTPEEACLSVSVELTERAGAERGPVPIELGATEFNPDLSVGDSVRVVDQGAGPDGVSTFSLTDFERRGPILWLALAFALLVILFGRLRGGLSLIGLVVSLGIVLAFIVPAIRDGASPGPVAVVGAMAVMLVTISLAHGLGVKSIAAMLGTTVSLIGVALLALLFTELTKLTGFSSEEATIIASQSAVSIQGLLLAGMVIGALGVLDDVTVSQASTVIALRKANPSLDGRALYARSIEVGRDHVSATVNTLVLAYVGASLPILLLFSAAEVGFWDVLNSEVVAAEVVSMLVGSIGLIAAVPITTALASLLARNLPDTVLEADSSHGHAH